MPTARPIRLALLLAAAALLLPPVVSAAPLSGLRDAFKSWGLFQGLQVSGSNSFTVQQNMVQGSNSAYEGQRWDTDPFMTQNSLSVEGPVWKEFSFKADFSASGYGQSYSRWVAGFVGHDTAVYYGDLNIDLSGNQFASFSKSVAGWQIDQKIGKGLARAFYSKEKAITRTQTIAGNNTSGPFFLSYTPIVEGSEVVKVNEDLQEFGVDYKLDYDSGQLWFETEGRPPKIIPDTATITVSYQSSGYESDSGTLYGARVLMPLMKDRLQVGVTMLKQDRGGGAGAHDTVGYQEDIFNGSGSVGPFDVNYRPIIADGANVVYQGKQQTITHPLVVLVDNVEQVEGLHYDSYRSIGRIIFRSTVAPTALVIIRYYYDLSTDTTVGNNSILGVDLLYHITPKLNMALEWGKSDGGESSNTGDALRLNVDYSADKLKVVGEYRDIAPTFTFMDSVGFYRQDKGLDVGVNWQPAEHVSVYARRSDLKTNQGYSFGYNGGYNGGYNNYNSYGLHTAAEGDETDSTLDIKSVRNDFELKLDYPNWPTFAFQREQLQNSGGSSSDSSYLSNNYSVAWNPANKPFTFSASLYQTQQDYTPLEGETTTVTGTNTRQMQWAASYRPSDRLSISYNQGRNRSTSAGSTNSSSSSSNQLSIRWAPSSKLDFNYDRTNTSSVGSISSSYYNTYALATLGLLPGRYSSYAGLSPWLNPAGIGDGGGIGGDDDGETEENRYTDNNSRFSIRYSPSQKLSLDFSLSKRAYTSGGSVGYLADSNQTTRSLSAMYQLNDSLSFNATWGADSMAFLEEGRGTVVNNTMTVGANYRKPNSPWGLSLSFNKTDGSSPTYTGSGSTQHMYVIPNNMTDTQARLSYALSDDSELSLTGQLSDYAGGYANFNKQQLEVGYRRKISNVTDLTFGYRFIRNVSKGVDDPRYGNTSLNSGDQNYLANTFLLTLSSQFNSGMGGRASGGSYGFGGSSLGNFAGYRAGGGLGRSGYSNFGTGYGGNFQNMGVFGQNGVGGGFSSPFGMNAGSDEYNGFDSERPQGYETFGSGFGGGGGGFTSGLGDISGGRRQGARPGDMAPLPPGQGPGEAADIEDWYNLDDMYSVWW